MIDANLEKIPRKIIYIRTLLHRVNIAKPYKKIIIKPDDLYHSIHLYTMTINTRYINVKLGTFFTLFMLSLTAIYSQSTWTEWNLQVMQKHFLGATVLLQDGRVMIIGGKNSNSSVLASAEIIDPISGTILQTPPMETTRYNMRALLLKNGKVLVIGGQDATGLRLNQCEIYDPIANSWTQTGNMISVRERFTVTLLNDGRVLVTGGSTGSPFNGCELFNPNSGRWSAAPALPQGASNNHAAVLLPNGKVLVTNGYSGLGRVCQVFDPLSNDWSLTQPMQTHGSGDHTLTLLPNGKVLLTGGWPPAFSRTEIYDPQTNQWTTANPLRYKRAVHNATLLPNGKLLISGGIDSHGGDNTEFSLATTELYSPQTGVWTAGPNLPIAMDGYGSCVLPDGRVLFAAGGRKTSSPYERPDEFLGTILTWQDATPVWSTTGSLYQGRSGHSLTLLPTAMVLAVGGATDCNDTEFLSSSELFDFRAGTWNNVTSMQQARAHHTTTLLADATAIVVGGRGSSGALASTEIYEVENNRWTAGASLSVARFYHTATLLHDGSLLVTGGTESNNRNPQEWDALSSTERYIPSQQTWQKFSPLNTERFGHTATLLPNGMVLVVGGWNMGSGYLTNAELYNPSCNNWLPTSPMSTARLFHTATLLPNGKVLVAGGKNALGATSTAELYDYQTNTWTTISTMPDTRVYHTATLLPDGTVLISGGAKLIDNLLIGVSETLIYNTMAETWSRAVETPNARIAAVSILLPDNNILLSGGHTTDCSFPTINFLYKPQLGYDLIDRPRITLLTPTIIRDITGSGYITLELQGVGFQDRNNRHGSEAGSGNVFGNATNYPIVEIKRIGGDKYDNDFAQYLPFDVGNFEWSDTATRVRINKTLLQERKLPSGYYRLSVIANGIPSLPTYFAIIDTSVAALTTEIAITSADTLCIGESIQLEADPGFASYLWSTGDTSRLITVTQPGTYSVTARTNLGCFAIKSKTIVGKTVSIVITGPDTMCTGDRVVLRADSGFVSYSWSTGDTSQIIFVTQPGIYSVTAQNESNCRALASKTITGISCDSLDCYNISGTINQYAAVSNIDITKKILTVQDIEVLKAFKANDQVLILQMQGANITTSNTEKYGTIESINGAGNYEFGIVKEVQNNRVVLMSSLRNSYDIQGKIQLVQVPEYDHVTVSNTLTCPAWNGETGGIIALFANCITLDAGIDVSGKGFRGGVYIDQPGCVQNPHATEYISADSCYWSHKGEGIAGNGIYPYLLGKGSPANAGGGGNNHNAGGGGGGNYAKGGNGGYGYEGVLGNRKGAAGLGGKALNSWYTPVLSGKVFMGGGGGAGHANHNNGSGGAHGGGIIIIRAHTIRNPAHTVLAASGASATNDSSFINPDGCGGGGAGGTIFLDVQSADTLTLDVRGGNGGSIVNTLMSSGPGGGGAGGFIALQNNLRINSKMSMLTQGGSAGQIKSGYTSGAESGSNGRSGIISVLEGYMQEPLLSECRGCIPGIRTIANLCGKTEVLLYDAAFPIESITLNNTQSNNVELIINDPLPLKRSSITIKLIDENLPGVYSFRTRNSNNREAEFSGIVTPIPYTPTISFDGRELLSSPAISYQWSLEGYSLYNGKKRSYIPTLPGNYTVTITDTNGCTITSEPYFLSLTNAQYTETSDVTSRIYPNPASDIVVIDGEVPTTSILEIEVRDVLGRVVKHDTRQVNFGYYHETFSLDGFIEGMYIFTIKTHHTFQAFPIQIRK